MKGFKQLVTSIRPSKSGVILAIITFLFSFFTLLVMEVTHRGGSITAFFKWSQESTVSFGITLLLLFFFAGALLFLPNILFIPLIVLEVIFLFIVSFGSITKFQLRGEYFTPFDLYLLNEGADISTFMNGLIGWKEIAGFIGMIVVLVLFSYFFIRYKKEVAFTNRLLLSVTSIICVGIIYTNPTLFSARSYTEEVETVESYRAFGFIGAYLTLWEKAKNAAPDEYDRGEITRILDNINNTSNEKDEVDSSFKPNVIVVLAEALWDPLLLNNINFKEDPLPYFRSLMENHNSGILLTHTYGGGTFNTELEVLTGLSTRFTPEETYHSQITRPIDSLPYVFKSQGYHTAAVHNFKNWYYGRNEVYRWIGLEKFVSMEFFNNPDYIGPFIDDRLLMGQVLDELKQTEGPDFLNVVTVASHGPYTDKRYEELPELTSSNMTEESKYILNLYTNLLKELDDSIKLLIEGVKETNEPTMVVIYGDHLPFLGEDNAVFKESGYYNGDLSDYKEYRKMYETPVLVWDNFSDQTPREDLRMTPNFLGSYILAHAKKEMSPIFSMNRMVYNHGITEIPKINFYQQVGIQEEDLHDFQLIQYDALKGNQYSYRNLGLTPAEDYLLGSGKMELNSIQVEETSSGTSTLTIQGKNLVSNAKVYVDGNEQEMEFNNSSQVTSVIKKDSLKDTNSHSVVIKLQDDKGTVIAETKTKTIKIK
ncbi:MAG: LTA synthase family protein [Neobacillus sp.]